MKNYCIVLAGGLGTRLKSVVPELPKCLAPISGKPFLDWQIRSLLSRGVSDFIFALGHGSDDVIKFLESSSYSNFSFKYVVEEQLLGTGGATLAAMMHYGVEESLVINGDSFLGGNLTPMLNSLDIDNNELMRIATVAVSDRARFGGVAIDQQSRVINFIEKGVTGYGLINAGLYRININAFKHSSGDKFSMETDVMPLLASRKCLSSAEMSGPFIDIGIPVDYNLFSKNVLSYVRNT